MQHDSQKGKRLEQAQASNEPDSQAWDFQHTTHRNTLFKWLPVTMFPPHNGTRGWSRSASDYLFATLGQLAAIAIIGVIAHIFPTMRFCESLLLLVIFLAALGWGIGPAILATCVGTVALFILWQYATPSSIPISPVENVLHLILYTGVGFTLSILTSRAQYARHSAQAFRHRLEEIIDTLPDPLMFYDEQGKTFHYNKVTHEIRPTEQDYLPVDQMLKDAHQLATMLDAVPDAILLLNQDGKPIRSNKATRELLALDPKDDITELCTKVGMYLQVHNTDGSTLPFEQWPSSRILRGEVIEATNAAEVMLHTPDERTLFVSMTGRPSYDAEQKVVGAVTVVHDMTERHKVVQRANASEHEAAERGRQLEATFNAIIDGVVIYDAVGRMLRINTAYSKLIALDRTPQHALITPEQRGAMLALRDEYGHPLTGAQQPVQRMLAGEIFTANRAMDIQVHALDGREVQLNVTGTAMYDMEHQLTGGVLIFRDVTERRALERRTQEALEALLTMAAELVHLPEHTEPQDTTTRVGSSVSKPLTELIRRVLGCQRVSLTSLDQQTGTWHSLAVVGLSAEQEKLWYERQPGFNLREFVLDKILADEQQVNDPLVLDFTQPPLNDRPNPFGMQTMILAPMKIGVRLIGMLVMDHGNNAHVYTPGELTLTKAVADLSALVIEREHLQREQAKAQADVLALHKTNRLMDEFIGIAGHELRTPLTTIKASVQLASRQIHRLLQQDSLPTSVDKPLSIVKGHLDRTERQIGMQSRLVNDLLDISRIHADRLELHPELCDLAKLVSEVVEDQLYITPQRTIELQQSTLDEILVLADADRIRQVVSNYLSNALKYSEAYKPVWVSIELLDTHVRISVRDEGPGLTLEQQQHIWDRFYRVPGITVQTGSGVGLGLGLHISRMIIERHNGTLGIESEPGHGSTFWFVLPLLEQKSS